MGLAVGALWIVTPPMLCLLILMRPRRFELMFSPQSALGRWLLTGVFILLGISGLISLFWSAEPFGDSVPDFGWSAVAIWIWGRFFYLVATNDLQSARQPAE